MNSAEAISAPDRHETGDPGASLASGDAAEIPRRPGFWLTILLRILGILAILYFVPE